MEVRLRTALKGRCAWLGPSVAGTAAILYPRGVLGEVLRVEEVWAVQHDWYVPLWGEGHYIHAQC